VPGDGHLVEVIRAACVHGIGDLEGLTLQEKPKRDGSIGGFGLV